MSSKRANSKGSGLKRLTKSPYGAPQPVPAGSKSTGKPKKRRQPSSTSTTPRHQGPSELQLPASEGGPGHRPKREHKPPPSGANAATGGAHSRQYTTATGFSSYAASPYDSALVLGTDVTASDDYDTGGAVGSAREPSDVTPRWRTDRHERSPLYKRHTRTPVRKQAGPGSDRSTPTGSRRDQRGSGGGVPGSGPTSGNLGETRERDDGESSTTGGAQRGRSTTQTISDDDVRPAGAPLSRSGSGSRQERRASVASTGSSGALPRSRPTSARQGTGGARPSSSSGQRRDGREPATALHPSDPDSHAMTTTATATATARPAGRTGTSSLSATPSRTATGGAAATPAAPKIPEDQLVNKEKFLPNGNWYKGQWHGNKMHGKGVYRWADGSEYIGAFQNGSMEGVGQRTWIDGRMYRGLWERSKPHGRGAMVWPTGETYHGNFENGEFHGQGQRTWPNGDQYVGEFHQGKEHGRGTLRRADGFVYEGQWKLGMMSRKGKATFPDGVTYDGEWLRSTRHGKGKQMYPDGTVYEGEFSKDRIQGYGKKIFSDGTVYRGHFVEGHADGEGTCTWTNPYTNTETAFRGQWKRNRLLPGPGTRTYTDGSTLTGDFDDNGLINAAALKQWPDGTTYSGSFKNNHPSGKGTLKWADGSQYIGDLENGKMQGRGTLRWNVTDKSGKVLGSGYYKGNFDGNDFQGQGEMVLANGNTYTGQFVYNLFEGEGTYRWKKEACQYQGQWSEGKLHGVGEMVWDDGGSYKGTFKDGHFDGSGTRVWPSGDSYTGEWVRSKFHGIGRYTWASGVRITAVFVDGVACGHGEKVYPDGGRYLGQFDNDLEHGQGVMVHHGQRLVGLWHQGSVKRLLVELNSHQDGSRFLGGFTDPVHARHNILARIAPDDESMDRDIIQQLCSPWVVDADGKAVSGEAVVWYGNGNKYIGRLKKGKKHGLGVFVYADMTTYQGKWRSDELLGVRHPMEGGLVPERVRLLQERNSKSLGEVIHFARDLASKYETSRAAAQAADEESKPVPPAVTTAPSHRGQRSSRRAR